MQDETGGGGGSLFSFYPSGSLLLCARQALRCEESTTAASLVSRGDQIKKLNRSKTEYLHLTLGFTEPQGPVSQTQIKSCTKKTFSIEILL